MIREVARVECLLHPGEKSWVGEVRLEWAEDLLLVSSPSRRQRITLNAEQQYDLFRLLQERHD